MAFDTSGLDEACLGIGDDFSIDGGESFSLVPTFTSETTGSDGFEINIGERLTASTTQAVVSDNEIKRNTVITHNRNGNTYAVIGFLPDDTDWVTLELERDL